MDLTTSVYGILCVQIANTEECIDGQLAGNLGVLIRYGYYNKLCDISYWIHCTLTSFIHSYRMNS